MGWVGLGRRYPTAFCIYMEARLHMGVWPRTQGGLWEMPEDSGRSKTEEGNRKGEPAPSKSSSPSPVGHAN